MDSSGFTIRVPAQCPIFHDDLHDVSEFSIRIVFLKETLHGKILKSFVDRFLGNIGGVKYERDTFFSEEFIPIDCSFKLYACLHGQVYIADYDKRHV